MLSELNSDEMKNAARLFAALGHETRLGLLSEVSGPIALAISELSIGTGMTRQAVTKHLQVLQEAGLVKSTRDGRHQLWQMNLQQLRRAQKLLRQIEHQWDDALSRLKGFTEKK